MRRLVAWIRSHPWTITMLVTLGLGLALLVQIRVGQVDGCHRGNTLRGEISASNTVLAKLIGATLPAEIPPLQTLTTAQRLFLTEFQSARVRLNIANARLGPSSCGSIWGL